MATQLAKKLSDISFYSPSGDTVSYYDPTLVYNPDIPKNVQKALQIQDILKKNPLIKIITADKRMFISTKANERKFILKDKKIWKRIFKNKERWSCLLSENKDDDNKQLDEIITKLTNEKYIKLFPEAVNAGASPVKLLFRDEGYLYKYVNAVSRKGKKHFSILF